jgi:Rap1a immunity proteins
MKKTLCITFFLLFTGNLSAAPTGEELLAACETSLKSGFHGANGMMCVWYVTPCDCHHGKEVEIARVCLPEGKETESLAREVIAGLKSQPELLMKSAEVSANEILAAKYPCD